MKKVILSVLFCVCCMLMLVAQSTGSVQKVLSAKDVDAFFANHAKIEKDLEALGDTYEEYFDFLDEEATEDDDFSAEFLKMRKMKVPADIQAIMKKHGLGENGFEKYVVISFSISILMMETMLAAQESEGSYAVPEMKEYFNSLKEEFEALKKVIHKDDLKLVSTQESKFEDFLE